MKRKTFIIILNMLWITSLTFAQSTTYSKVRIYLNEQDQISDLIQQGILTDHFSKSAANSIDVEMKTQKLQALSERNIAYDVLVEDCQAHYLSSLSQNQTSTRSNSVCDLENFYFGTMGHYHTYDQILEQLDLMAETFPDLISPKMNIGTSIEGRTIYAVKISDNPTTDETHTEGSVYFDALHHAREPMSMESLLYYMWWLLENYNTDADATYLVNNRELHFVPVVNPDGYVYNQTTNPSGGGFWRKNRRDNGDGSFGVDLNRNYSSSFGDPVGSSGNPSSETYRGESAFSEPETQAVRDYFTMANPSIAFCCHTHGQKFITSPGCFYPLEDFESYAEFSSGFINNTFDGYGTTSQMLGYSSCGTTRHYMHDQGVYAWTPEIGSSFWPAQSEFCFTVQSFLEPMKYISFVSGSYPQLNDFSIAGNGDAIANETLELELRIKNRGLRFSANNVTVKVSALTPNCTAINSEINYGNINPRSFATNTFQFFVHADAPLLDNISFQIDILEDGFTTHTITKEVTVGKTNVIFEDDAENGIPNWTTTSWDSTFIDFQSGLAAFADSRYGNYESASMTSIDLTNPIDLSESQHPILQFNSKWSFEAWDNVVLQISSDQVNWLTLESYSLHEHWVQRQFELMDFMNETVYFRFVLTADNGVQSDGFYFDDFKIVEVVEAPLSSVQDIELSNISISPNPSTGETWLIFDKKPKKTAFVQVHNTLGQLIKNYNIPQEDKYLLDLKAAANGLYLITILEGDKKTSLKFLKQ